MHHLKLSVIDVPDVGGQLFAQEVLGRIETQLKDFRRLRSTAILRVHSARRNPLDTNGCTWSYCTTPASAGSPIMRRDQTI